MTESYFAQFSFPRFPSGPDSLKPSEITINRAHPFARILPPPLALLEQGQQ